MLPVFRLPEVSKNPAGGFLRRLPRKETQREREIRLREVEELEIMKKVLGLTDRELEALEEELLPGRERGGQSPAVTSRLLKGTSDDNIDIEKGSHERLYGHEALGKQKATLTGSFSGKRRRRVLDERKGSQRDKYRDRCGGRRAEVRLRDNDCLPASHNTLDLDLPTPRVLRQTTHSTLGAELAASAVLSVRRAGEGKKMGAWTSTGEIGLGMAAGSILGATVKTEQLVAAAADVGMVNLLELRRALGQSVGQVNFALLRV